MNDERNSSSVSNETTLPWPQYILDDIFLLLAFGVLIPFLIYIVWGLMEMAHVPLFTP